MDIKIGKADIASLGCEGCKKKFICNICSALSPADKTSIESTLGLKIPEQDPPAIMDNSGGEGEKGILQYILQSGKTVISSDKDSNLTASYTDSVLGNPYVLWDSTSLPTFSLEDSRKIGKAEYDAEDNSMKANLQSIASRGVDFIYQMSFSPNFSSLYSRLSGYAVGIYSGYGIKVSAHNSIRPDLIQIILPMAGVKVLSDDFSPIDNDGRKYILRVCDIKTSEFTNSFFFELAYYMILLKCWLTDNALDSVFDVSYDAKIFPFDVVNNKIRDDIEWKMDFSLIKDKILDILNTTIPETLNGISHGDKSLIEKVKCSPRCQVCDYYGGQFEGKLFLKYRHDDPTNGEDNYRAHIQNPTNNYCRYYLPSVSDVNILSGIHACDIKYLQDKALDTTSSLKTALVSQTPVQDNSELLANSQSLIKEIDVIGRSIAEAKVDATKAIPSARTQLRIFTFIRQDSQQRMLGCGISYNIYVPSVDTSTTTGMNVDATGALLESKEEMLVEVDQADANSKLTVMISYITKMHEVLERYSSVRRLFTDATGATKSVGVTYGIYYWGRKTYDAFKNNLGELLEFLSVNGGSVASLYSGTRMTLPQINALNRRVVNAINNFANMFTDERITDYERILKNPLFDLQKIYKELAAVDTNFQYNLIDVYNVVTGNSVKNFYYRPDSDNYSVYIYDKWYSIDRSRQSVEKAEFEAKLKAVDRQHLYYLSILCDRLYDRTGVFGGVVKNGNAPVLGEILQRPSITIPEFMLLYLFRKLDAAYDQVEIEDSHVCGDLKKQYSGKGIYLERELTSAERVALSISLMPNQRAYKIPDIAENANFDESSFGLTVYPQNKFSETFKKFTNDSLFAHFCIFVNEELPGWTKYTGRGYSDIVNCKIAQIDITQQFVILEYEDWILNIMTELHTLYGYDFTRDMFLESAFKDVWSSRLKNTIESIQRPRSVNKRNLVLAPTLIHDYAISDTDVERKLLTVVPAGNPVRLDDSQRRAIASIFNDNISLLWGPPGTGKSHTLAHYLLLELIEKNNFKILLLGNYTATDNLCNSLLETIDDYGAPSAICSKFEIIRMHSEFKALEQLHAVARVKYDDWVPQASTPIVLSRDFSIVSSTPESFAKVIKSGISPKFRAINDFDVVIVDEASQMDVGHFLTALLKVKATNGTHTKLVIAGDDKQLQPVQKTKIKENDTSWFGSIYNYYKNYRDASGTNIFTPLPLEISRRSNHCIIDFIREAFGYNASFISDVSVRNQLVSYVNAGYSSAMYEKCLKPEVGLSLMVYSDGLSSQRNSFEETQIVNVVLELWRKGLTSHPDFEKFFEKGVGIVIPHRAQCTAIRKRLITEFKRILPTGSYSPAEIKKVINASVDTVERFQGQQRDIILAGYVLGNEDAISDEETFIYDSCRLNVVISRARYKAIIIASRELMDNISNDIDVLELQKAFQKLKVYCNDKTAISEPGWNNGELYTKEII